MKITEKVIARIVDSIRDDLVKISEEQGPRLLKALDEQVRGGGESSIRLGIDVVLTDKGSSENAVEVQTKYGFVRKVKDEDAYIPHLIDLGETLFDRVARESKQSDSGANDDELVGQAIEIVRATKSASTSIIQRRMRIGYTRASRIMDILEERGIVGPAKGSDAREVFLDKLACEKKA